MNNCRSIILLLLTLLLASCTIVPVETPETLLARARTDAVMLPGATISGDGMLIRYPGENLFAQGAVLPWPGGLEVLDPLIDLLKQHNRLVGVGIVRSGGHDEAYDRQLAEKRKELITRIFLNRGLAAERFQLMAEVGEGVPFEMELQPIISEISPGVNK